MSVLKAKINVHCPGSGFDKCSIEYTVQPVGSDTLYKLESVVRDSDGQVFPVAKIEELNGCVDNKIARAIHSEYAQEVLNVDLEKLRRWNRNQKRKTISNPSQLSFL